MTHTITVIWSCGHKLVFNRVRGGVTDPSNCNCEACQPWDGKVEHARKCYDCEPCTGNERKYWFRVCDVKPDTI